jgi:DNA-binding CsgD family transcriptional regulator
VTTQLASAMPVTVPLLTRFGRTSDADLVYRTLIATPTSTAEELTRLLGMARQRIRSALDELYVADVVVPLSKAGGVRWRAHPPERALAALRRNRTTCPAPDRARAHHSALSAAVGGRTLPLGEGIRLLTSRVSARERLAELVAAERHEHLAMNPELSFDAESARAGLKLTAAYGARDVETRTLGVMSPDLDDTTREMAASHPGYRRASAVPMKLIVIDRRTCLFPVAPTDYEQGYLEVTQPAVVSALAAMFQQHWDDAAVARARPPMDTIELTPREQSLLALLAVGHTDVSAAAELRISARSVSTILRGLMDRVGVENRFQLGLALGALSATPLPPQLNGMDQ